MSGHDFNPYNDPVARELHDANDHLRAINEQLWEASQSPDVRAARQAIRADQARTNAWGVRLVLALVALWVMLALFFGQTGAQMFGRLVSFVFDALGVILVVGGFLWVGSAVRRGARRVAGRGESRP